MKISQLPNAGEAVSSDLLPIVRQGANLGLAVGEIVALVPPAGAPSLTSTAVDLAANVTLATINVYFDVLFLTLEAGTWLLIGRATCGRAATGATRYTARLSTGTEHYGSAQFNMPSLNPHVLSLPIDAVVTLTVQTTVKLQVATTVANSLVYAAATSNGSGNNVTQLAAIRIA